MRCVRICSCVQTKPRLKGIRSNTASISKDNERLRANDNAVTCVASCADHNVVQRGDTIIPRPKVTLPISFYRRAWLVSRLLRLNGPFPMIKSCDVRAMRVKVSLLRSALCFVRFTRTCAYAPCLIRACFAAECRIIRKTRQTQGFREDAAARLARLARVRECKRSTGAFARLFPRR